MKKISVNLTEALHTNQRQSKQKLKGKLKICLFFLLPLVHPISALFGFKNEYGF